MTDDELEWLTSQVYRAGLADGVSELSAGIAAHKTDKSSARSIAVAAGALLVRYKLGQQESDLLAALSGFQRAHELEPSASRAANMAAALLELNDIPDPILAAHRGARHSRAVELLRWAIALSEPGSSSWVTRSTTLTGALLDAVVHGFPGADVAALLESAHATVDAVGRGDPLAAEPYSLLGSAHLVAADLGHPSADLDIAVEALQHSVRLTVDGQLDKPARVSNLASALLGRYERTGCVDDLRQAVAHQREAAALLDDSDARRGQLVNNLANALRALYQRTGTYKDLLSMRQVLDELVSSFSPSHPNFATARSNAGLIAVDVATILEDDELLESGIRLHVEALNATQQGHPQRAGRLASYAVALMSRYDRQQRSDDLQRALEIGEVVLADPGGPDHERAVFLSSQGSARHAKFLRWGQVADLEESTRLHRAALAGLERSNPFTPALLSNAAVALSDRYERLGEVDDLRAALQALRDSVALSGRQVGADIVGRLNNLALALLRLADLTADEDLVAEAVATAERTVGHADEGVPIGTQLVAWGTLLDALRQAEDVATNSEALESVRARMGWAWESAAGLIQQARPASQGAWLLRAAVRRHQTPSAEQRRYLLLAAIDNSLESRPHVALSAARQLAMDSLLQQGAGSGGGDDVQTAAVVVESLTQMFRTGQDQMRHAMSWQSEVTGFWDLVAHSRYLRGDPQGAVRAYEGGHAVLIADALDASAQGRPSQTVVTVWATPQGGAAVVQRSGGTSVVPVDLVPVDLPALTSERAATWVRLLRKASQLGQPVLHRTLERVRGELGPALISPIAAVLEPDEPLLWATGGAVALLPIGCVPTSSGEPFASRHLLRTAPTARLGAWAERVAATRGDDGIWASFADPEPSAHPSLIGAAAEARVFADEGHAYVGRECTRERVIQSLGQASMVHFAMHARQTTRDPLMNHLLTATDVPVFAQDVITSRPRARLAILSACDTAAPGVTHTDEGLGLAGAFLAAGVPGVIASLWSVGDLGTSHFMHDVIHALRDGASPSVSLSQATALARAREAPIADWAGFVLMGA